MSPEARTLSPPGATRPVGPFEDRMAHCVCLWEPVRRKSGSCFGKNNLDTSFPFNTHGQCFFDLNTSLHFDSVNLDQATFLSGQDLRVGSRTPPISSQVTFSSAPSPGSLSPHADVPHASHSSTRASLCPYCSMCLECLFYPFCLAKTFSKSSLGVGFFGERPL